MVSKLSGCFLHVLFSSECFLVATERRMVRWKSILILFSILSVENIKEGGKLYERSQMDPHEYLLSSGPYDGDE